MNQQTSAIDLGMRRCTASTARGTQCRNWAVRSSDPPRCGVHSGEDGTETEPKCNKSQETDGRPLGQAAEISAARSARFADDPDNSPDPTPTRSSPQTIEDVFRDLAQKQARLSEYLEAQMEAGASVEALLKVYTLHAQTASRLARLLRDQRALDGEAADGLAGAVEQALAELGTEWGVDLC